MPPSTNARCVPCDVCAAPARRGRAGSDSAARHGFGHERRPGDLSPPCSGNRNVLCARAAACQRGPATGCACCASADGRRMPPTPRGAGCAHKGSLQRRSRLAFSCSGRLVLVAQPSENSLRASLGLSMVAAVVVFSHDSQCGHGRPSGRGR